MTDAAPTLREQAERFPQEPGIYFFRNTKGRILYIGKAKICAIESFNTFV